MLIAIPEIGELRPHYPKALNAMQFHAPEKFVQAKKPILGICRSHQLLTAAFGGKLNDEASGRWQP